MITLNKRITRIVVPVALLLCIPLIGTWLTDEVNWGPEDFIVAAVLLLSTGFAIDFVFRKVQNKDRRLMICAVILVVLLLIWAELAVGIFGSPFAGS